MLYVSNFANLAFVCSISTEYIQCPKELGFICDLDAIIVEFIEGLLAQAGLDIDKILEDLVSGLLVQIPGLDFLDDIETKLPDLDSFFAGFLDTYVQPILDDLEAVPDLFDFNPLVGAFDTIGNVDINVAGGLELRYFFSKTNDVSLSCPSAKFPIVFRATRRTPKCGIDDFTAKIIKPPVSFHVVNDNYGSTTCNGAGDTINIPGFDVGILSQVAILYSCATSGQYDQLGALPTKISEPQVLACSPGFEIVLDDVRRVEDPCDKPTFRNKVGFSILNYEKKYNYYCDTLDPLFQRKLAYDDGTTTISSFFDRVVSARKTQITQSTFQGSLARIYREQCGGGDKRCYNLAGTQSSTSTPVSKDLLDLYITWVEVNSGIEFEWTGSNGYNWEDKAIKYLVPANLAFWISYKK